MLEQQSVSTSILGGGSEPVGLIPTIRFLLAFIGLSLCVQSTGIFTHHTTQIKSEEMGYVDKVSRTSFDEEFGFLSQDKKVDCNSMPCLAELLVICNPDKKENNLNHHDAHIIMARIVQSAKNNIAHYFHSR